MSRRARPVCARGARLAGRDPAQTPVDCAARKRLFVLAGRLVAAPALLPTLRLPAGGQQRLSALIQTAGGQQRLSAVIQTAGVGAALPGKQLHVWGPDRLAAYTDTDWAGAGMQRVIPHRAGHVAAPATAG